MADVIKTPREMMNAIAGKPSDLFYSLLVTLDSIPDPHPQNILGVFDQHGLRVAPDVAEQLSGARYQESDPSLELCVARPPWDTSKASAYPERPFVCVSLLFCELGRSSEGRQLQALVDVSTRNIIQPVAYVWSPKQADDTTQIPAPLLAQHIGLLETKGLKSVSTEYGQLKQI